TLDNGETQEVDLLVSAVGQLSRPKMPHIVGLESFEGPAFHSAQWDHSFDPKGKRVAVIGTGASAIQFVPHLAEDVAALTVFQRSPAYIAPKPDQPYTSLHRKMFGKIPATLRTERHVLWAFLEQLARGLDDDSPMGRVNKALCLQHLKKQVKDPVLRKKLTPDYPVGCKRVLFSNNYLPAIARPNVELVTEAVVEVKPNSVVAADGSEYDVDALVIGTGFDTQDFLNSIDITGVGGQKLASQWAAGARAYLGTYAPNFPNFFIMYGPNTNLGAGSIIYMLEAQARHMRRAVDRLVAGGYTSVAVTAEAEEAYDQDIQKRLANSVWSHCNSWYHHESGRITSNWPGATKPFAKRTKVLDPEAFEWTAA
ncbi:MAG: NAD(P)/FAD-dependent oxidoreductase, partial [Propionibacteriales bacterium]|nr:NAD(P)/FAD-dependent oxidoreductase [Propionibacteriales bacterium]